MSYLRKFEYKILPQEAYIILRHCPVCGIKSSYLNSNNFRVNANGNRIDVWLIYQCESCKNTYNLPIVERLRNNAISKEHYKGFLENDKELALSYGLDKSIFLKNKLEINLSTIKYQLFPGHYHKTNKDEPIHYRNGDILEIENPYGLKVRTDKMISELLHVSRTKAKQLELSGVITFMNNPGKSLQLIIRGDPYHDTSEQNS